MFQNFGFQYFKIYFGQFHSNFEILKLEILKF